MLETTHEPTTELELLVSEWAEEQAEDGYEGAVEDLLQHGCESGMVSELIYYDDTEAFYLKHAGEVDDLLTELLDGTGCSIGGLFGDKWDDADPLGRSHQNRNLLAWFAFEETARRLYDV